MNPSPRATRAPLVPAQIWDADEGGAAPADMAMPGTGVGMSHTSMRDFQELVTNLLGLPPCVALHTSVRCTQAQRCAVLQCEPLRAVDATEHRVKTTYQPAIRSQPKRSLSILLLSCNVSVTSRVRCARRTSAQHSIPRFPDGNDLTPMASRSGRVWTWSRPRRRCCASGGMRSTCRGWSARRWRTRSWAWARARSRAASRTSSTVRTPDEQ